MLEDDPLINHPGEPIDHRWNDEGGEEYLIQWMDQPSSEAVWLGLAEMEKEGMEIPSEDHCREMGWK